jgi:NAD(P)-dependent dehydrogenase (short-subunit alcohol dehydrogenase family)
VNIDDWDRTFAVNVRGVFLCYQYAAKQMVAQGRGGRIIGACSLAGKQGENQLTQAQRVKTMSTHPLHHSRRTQTVYILCVEIRSPRLDPGGRCVLEAGLNNSEGTEQFLATELGPHGITVNAYAPGESLFLARDMVRLAYIQILQE